jgi:hypothetical protein
MSTNGTLRLAEVRARAASALAPLTDTDPYVFDNVVESLEPPALVLGWDDPWLTPKAIHASLWDASFTVICIAGRLEPDPGIAALETLVEYTIGRLRDDSYQWPVASTQAPRPVEIAQITYLGARLTYRVPVTI